MYSTQATQGNPGRGLRRALTALLPVLVLNGCASMSNTDKGVLGGAGIGAVTGGIVGRALGNTAAGAAIGAGVGGLAGGLTGSAVDKAEHKAQVQAVAAQQQRAAVGLTDVVKMAQQGVSDAIIIDQIRVSGVVYNLTADEILWLQQNGVHEVVIREMQQSVYRTGPRRVVYTQAPVYVVEPYPPPVGVGFGVTYVGGRRHGR